MKKLVRSSLCLSFLLLAAGCSQYVEGYQYVPRPALAVVAPAAAQQPSPATVQASIAGIRRDHDGIPDSVEVRLRVDNTGTDAVSLDLASLELSNSALLKFPPPVIRQPAPSAQSAWIVAYFPMPEGRDYDDVDLSSLQLRWQLHAGPRTVSQAINFRRAYRGYYGPYYYGGYYGPPYRGAIVVGP